MFVIRVVSSVVMYVCISLVRYVVIDLWMGVCVSVSRFIFRYLCLEFVMYWFSCFFMSIDSSL